MPSKMAYIILTFETLKTMFQAVRIENQCLCSSVFFMLFVSETFIVIPSACIVVVMNSWNLFFISFVLFCLILV